MRTWSGHVAIHSLSLGKNKVVPHDPPWHGVKNGSASTTSKARLCVVLWQIAATLPDMGQAQPRKLNQGHLGASALRVAVLLNADFHFAPIKDAQRHIVVKR